jgi:hypothetical protein
MLGKQYFSGGSPYNFSYVVRSTMNRKNMKSAGKLLYQIVNYSNAEDAGYYYDNLLLDKNKAMLAVKDSFERNESTGLAFDTQSAEYQDWARNPSFIIK